MGATAPGNIVISLGTSDTFFAAMEGPKTDPTLAFQRNASGQILRANFQGSKVERLLEWMQAHGANDAHITAYSDSRNDLPLLEFAATAIAVDPDPVLRAEALRRGWPVISLRGQPVEVAAD